MSAVPAPYPLAWPQGKSKTEPGRRCDGQFKVSLATARDELLRELQLMNAKSTVITSNVAGIMSGSVDPPVSVWFIRKDMPMCIACDRYRKIEHNIRAIGLTVAALRSIERYDTGLFEQAVASFGAKALPATTVTMGWRAQLGLKTAATLADAEAAYRKLSKEHHPDVGGSSELMSRLNEAIEEARRELS